MRVRKRAKYIVAAAAIAGAAVALAGCGERSKAPPQSSEKNKTERLIVPSNLTPPVVVEMVKGAPEAWDMRNRVAAALRERDIPASTVSGGGNSSYTLKGRARPNREGKNGEVSLVWELFDPDGNKAGEIIQLAAVPETSWLQIKAPDLDAVAEAAAESIAPIVPSAALGGNQFATAGQKVRQRQQVDEETAARKLIKEKGAGPLQKRLAGLAGVDGAAVRKAKEKRDAARESRESRRAALKEAKKNIAREEAELAREEVAARKPAPLVEKKPVKTAKKEVEKKIARKPAEKKLRRKVIDPKVAAELAMKADPRKVLANPGGSSRVAAGTGLSAKARAAAAKAAASKTRKIAKVAPVKAAPVKTVRRVAAKPPRTVQVIDPGKAGELRGESTRRKLPPQTASRQPMRTARGPEFYWVQVGAYGDKATARAQYARMRALSPVNLRAVPHVIVRGSIGTTPIYRVRIGPFPNRNSAGGRCRNLKADGIDCFLKRTG